MQFDVLVIGAGPSGALAAALLVQKGFSVLVLEKDFFPRFSIGESLLPHCLDFLDEGGMLEAVRSAGFQFKNGAAFCRDGVFSFFDFSEKFSVGFDSAFQVPRADFDKVLADEVVRFGADVRFGCRLVGVDFFDGGCRFSFVDAEGIEHEGEVKFVLDGSGFGRVLPRLLDLVVPSDFPVRRALFCHVVDHISDSAFDRDKILICVHPGNADVWFWLIPFSNGVCSLGVVAEPVFFESFDGDDASVLRAIVDEAPSLAGFLSEAEFPDSVRELCF